MSGQGLLCLPVIEHLGMRHLPANAAEDLLEVLRRHDKGAIIVTSNRPLEDWGNVLGNTAAAGAILDRFLHQAEIIKLEGKSSRMHYRREIRKTRTRLTEEAHYDQRLIARSKVAGFDSSLTGLNWMSGGTMSLRGRPDVDRARAGKVEGHKSGVGRAGQV